MDFFNENHPGLGLSVAEIETTISNVSLPSGYLSRATIDLALTNDDCVGIRVYRLSQRSRRADVGELLVCGVLANGFDAPERAASFFGLISRKDTIFQLVDRVEIPSGASAFTPKSARQITRKGVEVHISNEAPLMAYFSKKMLNDLFQNSTVKGVLMYEVNLEPIKATKVPSLSVPDGTELASYAAFTVRETAGGQIQLPDFDQASTHVLSDLPCPGHCLQIDPKGAVSVGDMVSIQAKFDETPYPLPWDNNNDA